MPDELTTRLPVLYLYCNWRDSGWSERYWLRPQSWPEALAQGARIARWRIAAACTDTELIWGRIAFTDNPRLTAPLPNLGIRAIPRTGIGDGQLHTVYTRLHWRFETAAGDWVDRRVAGIPDDAVGPNGVTGDLETLRAGELPPDVDDPAASWLLTFRTFMTLLRDATVYASKRGVADPEFWRVVPWSKVLFRSPTTRNTGRDFRRVTWLPAMTKPPAAAGVDPPWDAAPAFNPCGAAVGVTRSCYSRACRWYVNGPIGRIRFAFVDRCAKILPYPTVFWPYSGDRELVNANQAGEITAEKFPFNAGRRRSQATGLHPIGSAADFAGESLLPWDPPTPTPLERIPCCAFGELQMEAIEYVRVTVDALPDLFTPAGGILTANVNARLADLDGRTLVKGDRLLLNNGLASAGIYTLTDVGKDDPSGRPWKMQRLQTCDGTAEYSPGQVIKVWDGDDNAHTLWELETDPPWVIDTTPLDFAELAGGGGTGCIVAALAISADQPALPIGSATVFKVAGATNNLEIQGIAGGSTCRSFTLWNVSSTNRLKIMHADAAAAAADRIHLNTSYGGILTPDSRADFWYDIDLGRWRARLPFSVFNDAAGTISATSLYRSALLDGHGTLGVHTGAISANDNSVIFGGNVFLSNNTPSGANIDPLDKQLLTLTVGQVDIDGIKPVAGAQLVTLCNLSGADVTIKHLSGMATLSTWAILCPGGVDFLLPDNACVDLVYIALFGGNWVVKL